MESGITTDKDNPKLHQQLEKDTYDDSKDNVYLTKKKSIEMEISDSEDIGLTDEQLPTKPRVLYMDCLAGITCEQIDAYKDDLYQLTTLADCIRKGYYIINSVNLFFKHLKSNSTERFGKLTKNHFLSAYFQKLKYAQNTKDMAPLALVFLSFIYRERWIR